MSTDQAYVPPQRIGFAQPSLNSGSPTATLVDSALHAFELDGYSIDWATQHSNITVRLVSEYGPPLALRLRSPLGLDARTELEWLNAVRRGTSVRTVEPFAEHWRKNTRVVSDRNGKLVECALFRWIEGQPLAAQLTEDNYHELGTITAKLHEFASGWEPPVGLKPLIWDKTIYYEGMDFVIPKLVYSGYVSSRDASMVAEVMSAADDELEILASTPDLMFLHGNLEMWNILTTATGRLVLLDFEDVMFGSPVLDIAITLFYGQERRDYAALSAAYENGYRTVRDWPVRDHRQLTLLFAARATMLLNHALETESDKQDVVRRLLPLIRSAAA